MRATRLPRVAAACLLSATLAGLLLAGFASSAPLEDTAEPVVLVGTGSGGIIPQMKEWGDALLEAPSPVDLSYFPRGGRDGKREFIRGEADFVVAGVGFSKEEQDELAAAKRAYVTAPIQPTALALLFRPPFGGLKRVEGSGEDAQAVPYEGPIRMPHATVGRAVFKDGNVWSEEAFKKALGVPLVTPVSTLNPVVRSDPGATNYYLQQYLKTAVPDFWAQQLTKAGVTSPDPTENWPVLSVPSRAGVPGLTTAVTSDFKTDEGAATQGGNIGPVPPWAAKDAVAHIPPVRPNLEDARFLKTTDEHFDLKVVELMNAAGEWVVPTPDSIAKGIEIRDGDGRPVPLGALSTARSGAYPLTWLNSLYAPTSGLAPEKANALATLIRYAATKGQDSAASYGDARLPDALAREALEAADELVRGNCTGADVELVSSAGRGPHSPTPDALSSVGNMLLCQRKARAAGASTTEVPSPPGSTVTTPTIPAPATGTPTVSSRPLSPGRFDPIGTLETLSEPESEDVPLPVAPDGPAGSRVAQAARLPFALPAARGAPRDAPITMLLGALLYWRAHALVRRRCGGGAG